VLVNHGAENTEEVEKYLKEIIEYLENALVNLIVEDKQCFGEEK
jgi:uncharacterized protein YgfB (UPF0149 family)